MTSTFSLLFVMGMAVAPTGGLIGHILPLNAVLAVVFARPMNSGEPTRHKSQEKELQWAKGIASDFMDAGFKRQYRQAVSLMSADMRKNLTVPEGPETFMVNRFGYTLDQARDKFDVDSGEISPAGDEAVFRGTCSGEGGQAEFTIRVVKEQDSGKWRVNYFVLGDIKKKK
jgi:hypothetical protein